MRYDARPLNRLLGPGRRLACETACSLLGVLLLSAVTRAEPRGAGDLEASEPASDATT